MTKTQENVREQQVKEFIKNLSQLDDGDRARLKRNAGNTLAEARQVGLLFYQKILPPGAPTYHEESYFLIATLYPFDKKQRDKDRPSHPSAEAEPAAQEQAATTTKEARAITLGASFRIARSEQNESGFDRRIARLLDADRQQLPFQLRQAILRLTADWMPIDWGQLTKDVLNWEHSSRYVQRQWARDYVASKPETN